MSEKEKLTAEIWDRSAAVDKIIAICVVVYQKHIYSVMKYNGLYEKLTKCEKFVAHNAKRPNLSRVVELFRIFTRLRAEP